MPKTPVNITDAWDDQRAEAAFHQAFAGSYEKPVWLRDVRRPFVAASSSAVVQFASGKEVRIKVLSSEEGVEEYKDNHPFIPVVVVVHRHDPPSHIRWSTFKQLRHLQ